MIRLGLRALLVIGLLFGWGTVAMIVVGASDLFKGGVDSVKQRVESGASKEPARERGGGRTAGREENVGEQARSVVERIPGVIWRATRVPLAIAVAVLFALLAVRWANRPRRSYVRMRLTPYRADETDPDEVVRLFQAWHQQLLERWWRRIPFGQPSMALELVHREREGQLVSELSIVCPSRLAQAVEGALLGCYADSHLEREERELPSMGAVLRLKKRFHFVRALRADEGEFRRPVDTVLSNMESLGRPAVVQYVFTPTPALFDRYSRSRYGAVERRSERGHARDPGQPGLRSSVLGQELEGGLRVQHHTLFFTEIRVGAQSYSDAMAIAAVLRGETSAENRLVVRYMRARRDLYLRRIALAEGNPIPGWRRQVMSSAELAGLWHLPSPGLKVVRLERTSVPRMPSPPEVSRAPAHMLMRDEDGPVGIRPEDKTDGLGLIGGQKTGKTSVLCRTVQADAHDPDCALVVLMPKPGDAHKALSMVPRDRTVHYLDLERPEFGINPLRTEGDPAMVADKIVSAFRDVNAEGDIRGSSDRYLRQAAQAAIGASRAGVVDGPPTLWHMYRILMPVEQAFRERVVEAIYPDPTYTDTATFFGRELPHDLDNSPGQTVAKLDAPRNKILRLLVEALDKVLRHPVQLSIDEVVARREVLIVDGKMGTFGSDNCRVMLQFILNSLYSALQRQQQLPERERVRVALKVDEAHLILNESFADAMATLRSGGLEVVAAWQYGEQIQDPKIRSGVMSLLRQRCMFSMGETQDARELSSIAMAVYADMIHSDPESRARMRVTPDVIFNLPNYHAVCSWISRGARAAAFMGTTIPLEEDDDVVRHHLEVQRERGCHVPDRLDDPMPDLDWAGLRELPSSLVKGNGRPDGPVSVNGSDQPSRQEAGPAPDPGEADEGAATADPIALEFDPAASSIDRSTERAQKPLPEGAPDTFTELDLNDVRGIDWEKVTPVPPDKQHEPTKRELEILAALWSHRFLYATQIRRRWWSDSSLRAAQQALSKMARAGWVRRFRIRTGVRGAQPRVYCLTRLGFELAQQHTGRRGPYIDPDAKWREPQVSDARRVLRDLHVNGWVLAFGKRAGKVMRGWRGPREGRLEPPRRRVRREWVDLRPEEVVIGSSHKLYGYEADRFEVVSPDATVELRIPTAEGALRFDLMLELDRARSRAASEDRLRRYDGLISGWSGLLDRYKAFGTPPLVVFVCEDEPSALSLCRLADRVVTARLAKPGTGEEDWPAPGRRSIFFAVERDIHMGSLEAFQLPELPPDLRERLHGKKARKCQPWRVHIIEPRLIDLG